MSRFLITMVACCLWWAMGRAQVVRQPPEEEASYAHDTALVNDFLHQAGGFALTKKTLDSAHYYLQKAYSLSEYRDYKKGLAVYYRILSHMYNTRHLYDSSMAAIKKEFVWAKQTALPSLMIYSYASLGILYQKRDELDSATKYYIKALNISDSTGDKKGAARLANNISILFHSIKDYKSSIKYARKGYQIGFEINDSLSFLNCLFNLAGSKMDMKEYDSALFYFEKVKDMVKKSARFYPYTYNVLINEGTIFTYQKKYKKSLATYNEVLKNKEKLSTYILGYLYENMGSTLYRVGQLQKAELYLKKAVEIDKQLKARSELKTDYDDLSEIKAAQKQFEEALKYRVKYDSLKDTLMSETTKKNMHLLQIKYQTAKKDKQIAQQKLTLTQKQHSIEKRTIWIWIVVCGLIALAFIFLVSRRNYRHKRKLHSQTLLTLKKDHELDTLKTKMETREEERNRIGREMHDDVGSALTTILYLTDDLKTQTKASGKQTADRIADTAEMVVDKMNEIIWSMNRAYDTLDDLIVYTRQHAAKFLGNCGLQYRFEAPDPVPDIHLQGEQRRNIYLVIKESLNNVVKHAEASKVEIEFKVKDNLEVTIKDNGKGIDKDKLRRFGNGLRNMKDRMDSVGGHFEIKINQGTLVIILCSLDEIKNV